MKIHNVFHPCLLRLYTNDPLSGQENEEPPPVVVDNDNEWEVDDILDAKKGPGHSKRCCFESNGLNTSRIGRGIQQRILSTRRKLSMISIGEIQRNPYHPAGTWQQRLYRRRRM